MQHGVYAIRKLPNEWNTLQQAIGNVRISTTYCNILFGKFRIDQEGTIEGLWGKTGLVAGAFGR